MVRCRQKLLLLALAVGSEMCATVCGFSIPMRSSCSKTLAHHRLSNRLPLTRVSVLALSSDSSSGVELSPAEKSKAADPARRSRSVTGYSIAAFRTTLRAATGISLTAVYASTLAISGAWVRQTMKVILSIFPSWARYFVQPFLIVYYVPLYMLRSMSSPQRQSYSEEKEKMIASWKETSVGGSTSDDQNTSYWPLDLTN